MLLPITREKAELIEVVRIADPIRHFGSEDLTGDEVALWEAPRTDRILALIDDLPDSELHRCFSPGWGIRVHGADGLLLQLAFCFSCHGIRLWGPGVPDEQEGLHGFDPDSAPARELLQRFRDAGSAEAG
ncbi:hypothetical protein ACFV1C_08445 [Streptomyces sp. NPDC059605]|uniref:hypothetical protein n=1 Tax=unclassified Streptomyces TaxID=2593676 RepID=UPI0033A1C44F